jgi:UDP-2,3-diacylglucosamine hydrolase
MHHSFSLKNGAFILSDAHYNQTNRPHLLELLKLIDKDELSTPQLILLGDNFDFLSYYIKDTLEIYKEVITLINSLSDRIEVIIFEGNHDFNLKKIFPNSLVIPRNNQPINSKIGNQSVTLAHGDLDVGLLYEIYRRGVENPFILCPLGLLNTLLKNKMSRAILEGLAKKKLCKKLVNFENLAEKRLKKVDSDYFIEGHYHQGLIYNKNGKIYASAPALICNKSFFLVEFEKGVLTLSFQNF